MIKYHRDLVQGTDEWRAARCGLLTASEMKHIITPKELKYSNSKEERTHMYELAAQRVTGYVEPAYISDDMLRGMEDEIYMRELYEKNYAPVDQVGFVTNDKWGFTLGYSPDGLVKDTKGGIEGKSRRQKFQMEMIVKDEMPDDFRIQVQTGMLVAELEWIDFMSYCGGMHMATKRIYPDDTVQKAILDAARIFEEKVQEIIAKYTTRISDAGARLIKTERRIEKEMHI